MASFTDEATIQTVAAESMLQKPEAKLKKGKKGKIFTTKDSMLALVDQITQKQQITVKHKLNRIKSRDSFLQDRKLKQEIKKAQKQNEIEAMKNKLKKKAKAGKRVALEEITSTKPKKQVRFT